MICYWHYIIQHDQLHLLKALVLKEIRGFANLMGNLIKEMP